MRRISSKYFDMKKTLRTNIKEVCWMNIKNKEEVKNKQKITSFPLIPEFLSELNGP